MGFNDCALQKYIGVLLLRYYQIIVCNPLPFTLERVFYCANMTITGKEETFIQKYIELDDATEAHRIAYGGGMSDASRKKEAHTIKNKPHVAARIKELQQISVDRHLITMDGQCDKLQSIYKRALADKEYAPAISAVMGQSKHHGLLSDKVQLSGKDGGAIEMIDVTPVDLARRIAFLLAKGVDAMDGK